MPESISKMLTDFLNYKISLGETNFYPVNLVYAIIVFIAILFLMRIVLGILKRYFKRSPSLDQSRYYSVAQILKYIFYVVAFMSFLQMLGVNMTVLWGAAAALMVGVGLGLQKVFSDVFSGILLLIENSVSVNDWLELGGLIAQVKKIGLRTSKMETRDGILMIVPNSKLTAENVINWKNEIERRRYEVKIGVAYGSDLEMVKQLLEQSALKTEGILNEPAPVVLFQNFGDSSLDFSIFFWSKSVRKIAGIKSELRFLIDRSFRNNSIEVPFPQTELTIKSGDAAKLSGGEY